MFITFKQPLHPKVYANAACIGTVTDVATQLPVQLVGFGEGGPTQKVTQYTPAVAYTCVIGTPDAPVAVLPSPKLQVMVAPFGLGVVPVKVYELQLFLTTLVICGLLTFGQQIFLTVKFKHLVQLP